MLSSLLKSLFYLLEPIGFIWGLLLVLTGLLFYKRRWRFGIATASIVFLLSLIGSTALPGWLLGTLERAHLRKSLADLPVCDAVVMLGGGVEPSQYDAFGLTLTGDGDRPIMALELMRMGRASALILGGAVHELENGRRVEAELTQRWFTAWKLTDAPIENLGGCENTHDEAVKVAKLFKERGWRQVLLVTSAYHMPRAEACFRTAGVPVICVPCDYKTSVSLESKPSYTLVPRYQGFLKMSLYIHEKLGWLIYRWRGWINPSVAAQVKPAMP